MRAMVVRLYPDSAKHCAAARKMRDTFAFERRCLGARTLLVRALAEVEDFGVMLIM
jgi:hypothetical protein